MHEIYEKNKNIEYGWKDKNGIIHSHINEGFVKNFNFQTTDELLKSEAGNCWETVELTRKELLENNIPCKAYFFVIPLNNFYCHSIAVAQIESKYYWVENSFKDMRGIHEFNSLEEIIFNVLNNFHKIVGNTNYNIKQMKIYEYEPPKTHISCIPFYFHCFRQKNITKTYLDKYIKSIEE